MPHVFTLPLDSDRGSWSAPFSGEVADDDWSRLKAFRDRARALEDVPWVASGKGLSGGFSGGAGTAPVVQWRDRPTDEDVDAVRTLLMPFVSGRSAVSLVRVLEILRGAFTHPQLAAYLSGLSAMHNGDRLKEQETLTAAIDAAELASLWADRATPLGPWTDLTASVFRVGLWNRAALIVMLAAIVDQME